MKLKVIHCQNCGSDLERKSEREYECGYCKTHYYDEEVNRYNKELEVALTKTIDKSLRAQKLEAIANARANLYKEIHEKDIIGNEIIKWCDEIKKYIPHDFQANFYKAAVSDNRIDVQNAINAIDVKKNRSYIEDILKFMLKTSLDENDIRLLLANLIDRAYAKNSEYTAKYCEYSEKLQKVSKEFDKGTYEVLVPRDVFVAYSSKDMKEVNKIVDLLERDLGLKCFVALRNLRHGVNTGGEKYDIALKKQLELCKCVVFISTENSRTSACDAIKIELPYVRKNFPNKPCFEYRIGTTDTKEGMKSILYDHKVGIFKGREWILDKNDLATAVYRAVTEDEEDTNQIHQLISPTMSEVVTSKEEHQKCNNCGEDNLLKATYCLKCGKRLKEEAEEAVDTTKTYETPKEESKIDPQMIASKKQKRVSNDVKKQHEEVNLSNYNKDEFEIKGKTLLKYKGKSTKIIIPNSVTRIGEGAFENCSSLTSVTFEEGSRLTSIGEDAFYNCRSLTSIVIPNSVTSIGNYAFSRCSSLTSIVIPNSVTSIGDWAFYGCGSLENVYYNGTIEDWCKINFSSTTSNPMYYAKHFYMLNANNEYEEVTEIVIPNTITSIGAYQFCGFSNVTSILIPNSVTSIGSYAFYNCSSLTSIVIPSNVTSIGNSAFEGCSSLTSIVIPNSVTSIGDYAFYNCSSLTIYCKAKSKPSGWDKDWAEGWKTFFKKPKWGYKK